MKAGFIGAGKAGCSLGRYLRDLRLKESVAADENCGAGRTFELSGFYSKTFEHSKEAADDTKSAAFSNFEQVISESDIIFITTPDRVIGEVWETIRKKGEQGELPVKGRTFCHLSGSLSSEVFCGRKELGAYGCAVHPMQAISSRDTDFSGTFFTADGDAEAVAAVKELLSQKGNPVSVIEPSFKKKYHMAASTASNLVVGLIQMALDALKECGFSQDTALAMLTPLIEGNVKNICEKGTAAALTGPVERGDAETVKAHLQQLTGERREIYRLLSRQLMGVAQVKNETRDYSNLETLLEEKDQ